MFMQLTVQELNLIEGVAAMLSSSVKNTFPPLILEAVVMSNWGVINVHMRYSIVGWAHTFKGSVPGALSTVSTVEFKVDTSV